MHYQRWKNNGDPLIDRRAGVSNIAWRGAEASYSSKHKRVYRVNGKADRCEWCGESQPGTMYHWASLAGDYDDLEGYVSLCVPCHSRYDGRSYGEQHGRAVLTERIVLDARSRHAAGESIAALARVYGVAKSTLQHAGKRETWKHI